MSRLREELETKFLDKLYDIMLKAEFEEPVERCRAGIVYDSEAILRLAEEYHLQLIKLEQIEQW